MTNERVILYAEDNNDLRSSFSEGLRKRGYRVFEAKNGTEALAILSDQHVTLHACIVDLEMPPGPTGAEVILKLDSEFEKIRCGLYVLTSGAEKTDPRISNLLSERLHRPIIFFEKPFIPTVLFQALEKI